MPTARTTNRKAQTAARPKGPLEISVIQPELRLAYRCETNTEVERRQNRKKLSKVFRPTSLNGDEFIHSAPPTHGHPCAEHAYNPAVHGPSAIGMLERPRDGIRLWEPGKGNPDRRPIAHAANLNPSSAGPSTTRRARGT